MGRYSTYGRCLDCQAEVGAAPLCPQCGLAQVGPDADRMRWHLVEADRALHASREAQARAGHPVAPVPVPTPVDDEPVAVAPVGPRWQGTPPLAPIQGPPTGRRRRGWPGLTTPTVLLGLGAICVVVAALVFVSVSWSVLSVGAKALILVAVTSLLGGLTWWLLRRGLRGSAETLARGSSLLVVLDFAAASAGGLLGLDALSDRTAAWWTGLIVVGVGVGWARVALRTPTKILVGVQLLALLGMWRLMMLAYEGHWTRTEYVAFVLVACYLAVAAVAARSAVWWFAVGTVALSALNLAIAYGASFVRVLGEPDLHGLWSTGRVSGWLFCLFLAAVVVAVRRLPMYVRGFAAAVVVAGVAFVLLRPLEGEGYDAVVAGVVGTFAFLALSSLVLLNPWRRGFRLGSVPVGLVGAWLVGPSVVAAAEVALAPLLDPWQLAVDHQEGGDTILVHGIGSPWLVGLALAALLAGVEIVVSRRVPRRAYLLAMVAAAWTVAVLRYDLPLWTVVAVVAALTMVLALVVSLTRSVVVVGATVASAALTFSAAAGSDVLTLVVAVGAAAILLVVAARISVPVVPDVAAAIAVPLAGLALVAAAHVAGQVAELAAYLLAALTFVSLLAGQARREGRTWPGRIGTEVGAVAVGAVAVVLAVGYDPEVQLPVVLTIVGAGLVGVALLSADRRLASVAGGVVLVAASWVRLWVDDVTAVEAYTLPTGLVLLALGIRHQRTHADAATLTVLGPGLVLCLAPSLLVALAEPTSLRALLVGLAGAAAVVIGAYRRWLAPMLVGGAVVLLLALANVGPYAAAVPRWVLFALIGGGLLYLGVTWEKRLRNARRVWAAVERLA